MPFSRAIAQSEYKQPCKRFELGLLISIPIMITITLSVFPIIYIYSVYVCVGGLGSTDWIGLSGGTSLGKMQHL